MYLFTTFYFGKYKYFMKDPITSTEYLEHSITYTQENKLKALYILHFIMVKSKRRKYKSSSIGHLFITLGKTYNTGILSQLLTQTSGTSGRTKRILFA